MRKDKVKRIYLVIIVSILCAIGSSCARKNNKIENEDVVSSEVASKRQQEVNQDKVIKQQTEESNEKQNTEIVQSAEAQELSKKDDKSQQTDANKELLFQGTGLDYSDIELGNTKGNDLNDGLMCESGEWVYYCDYNHEQYLCRKRLDGTEKQVLVEESCRNINVMNGYVFFNSQKDYCMKRCNLDGSDLVALNDEGVLHFIVTKEQIYFVTNYIECMDLDGNNRKIILSEKGDYGDLCFCNEYILYCDYSNPRIYAVNIEDGQRYLVIENAKACSRYGEYLYYYLHEVTSADSCPLRRYNLITGEIENVAMGIRPNIQGDIIYSNGTSKIRYAKVGEWKEEIYYPKQDTQKIEEEELLIDRYYIVNHKIYLISKRRDSNEKLQLYELDEETGELVLFE